MAKAYQCDRCGKVSAGKSDLVGLKTSDRKDSDDWYVRELCRSCYCVVLDAVCPTVDSEVSE